MNHTLKRAGRETHVRIVAIALAAGILVVVGALSVRTDVRIAADGVAAQPTVMKASRQPSYSQLGLVAVW